MFDRFKSDTQLAINLGTQRQLRVGAWVFGIGVIGLIVFGLVARAAASKNLQQWTTEQAVTTVAVITPSQNDANRSLELPGRFEAFSTAPIYARVPGYLKSWKVDIGMPVKAGQLLGEIETPDLDQQLLQARADMESASANATLAESTLKRMQSLLDTKVISRQEFENRSGDALAKQAQYQSAKANLERLQVTKGFARITAPFSGVVTERNTDVGALINVGSSTSPPLFIISDSSKLRLYINAPQNYSANIKIGDEAQITVPERQGKTYTAKVAATSGAIDSRTSTTRIQLALDNTSGELLPGSYARVNFNIKGLPNTLSVPASTLIFNAAGLRVATVGADNKVLLKPISIARDLGKDLEINGLLVEDRVIDNPPDGISNADKVTIKTADKPAAKPPV